MNSSRNCGSRAWACRSCSGGLAAVALAVSAAVLLVTSYVGSGLVAGLITACVAVMFGLLWFVFPLARR